MKQSKGNNNTPTSHGNNHKPRPEIRDDMDSRKTKEENYRGDKSKKGDKKDADA